MKWTDYFIPTSKEVPADATVASHQLMLRAGLIRQVIAGAYSYLPLGYRALRKVESIVREEMNKAGAVELHMPAMSPVEWWEQTGRVEAMGDVLMRLAPAAPDDWRSRTVLGPTHEEIITETARAYLRSYKQLPVCLYQIQTKFRGEARPKSGILRTREFLMKDAYSFHAALEGSGRLGHDVRAHVRRLLRDLRTMRPAVHSGAGGLGRDRRRRLARVHGPHRRRRGLPRSGGGRSLRGPISNGPKSHRSRTCMTAPTPRWRRFTRPTSRRSMTYPRS